MYDAIVEDALASPRIERCGLLFGDYQKINQFISARNVHCDPARHFEIDPAALIAAHRAQREGGPNMIGHYHTHPVGEAMPSARDLDAATLDSMLWMIIAPQQAKIWRPGKDGGGQLCFTAVDYTIVE